MRRSAACEGDHGHGAELVGGEVLRVSYGNGATGVGKAREREGKEAQAHSAPADVLKRARGGLGAAESAAKLVGAEEEDGGVVGVAVAPSSNGVHKSKQRTMADLGDTVERRGGHGGRG